MSLANPLVGGGLRHIEGGPVWAALLVFLGGAQMFKAVLLSTVGAVFGLAAMAAVTVG